MNASYQLGLEYINKQMKRALGTCTDPDLLFKKQLELETSRLSATERLEILTLRRESTIAAREITCNGSASAAVTKINPDDIIRQATMIPPSPKVSVDDNLLTPIGDSYNLETASPSSFKSNESDFVSPLDS
jgi:alpha,alpha-trehalase